MKYIIIGLLSFLSISSYSAESYFCTNEFESLPILQGGRLKPLYVHAAETIKNLTGKTTVKEYSAVEAYCLLSLNSLGINTSSHLNLEARIDHVDLMKFLGLKSDEHNITFEKLLFKEEEIKLEARTIKNNESYRKAINKLYDSLFVYKEIKNGENWMLADTVSASPGSSQAIQWVPLVTFLTEAKVIEQKKNHTNGPFHSNFTFR